MNRTWTRWRGLAALVADGVEHGSRAVERVQRATADRPFWVLERIPAVAGPARVAHAAHDASVTGVHLAIRGVTRLAAVVADAALAAAERAGPPG